MYVCGIVHVHIFVCMHMCIQKLKSEECYTYLSDIDEERSSEGEAVLQLWLIPYTVLITVSHSLTTVIKGMAISVYCSIDAVN